MLLLFLLFACNWNKRWLTVESVCARARVCVCVKEPYQNCNTPKAKHKSKKVLCKRKSGRNTEYITRPRHNRLSESNPSSHQTEVLVIAANQSAVKLTTHSACYQTGGRRGPATYTPPHTRGISSRVHRRRRRATRRRTLEWDTSDGTDVNSRTCSRSA